MDSRGLFSLKLIVIIIIIIFLNLHLLNLMVFSLLSLYFWVLGETWRLSLLIHLFLHCLLNQGRGGAETLYSHSQGQNIRRWICFFPRQFHQMKNVLLKIADWLSFEQLQQHENSNLDEGYCVIKWCLSGSESCDCSCGRCVRNTVLVVPALSKSWPVSESDHF